MPKLSEKQIKIIKTCILYMTFLSLGMCSSIVGPCLIDLQHLVATDITHIALVYTARSIGTLIGSVFGGILLDMVKSKLAVMTVCMFLVAGSMTGIPWSSNIEILIGYMAVSGVTLGAIENGGNVFCLNLWGKNSAPFYQGLHFTYGIGGLLSPVIAAPYLGDFRTSTTNNGTSIIESLLNSAPATDNGTSIIESLLNSAPATDNGTSIIESLLNSTSSLKSNSSVTSGRATSRVVYPFTIIGGYCVINAILLLAICIISPTERPRKTSDKKDNSARSFGFMFTVIFLTSFLLFVSVGAEATYAQILTTFAVKGRLQLAATVGSYMTSAFWAAFTLSRLVCVVLAIKLKNIVLLFGDIAIITASATVLLFLMPNEWALWLASVIFGVGIASFYPSTIGWLNEHINVTSKIASIYTIGAACGEMVVIYIISYYIESVPDVFAYAMATLSVLCFLITITLYTFFKRFDKKDECKKTEISLESQMFLEQQ